MNILKITNNLKLVLPVIVLSACLFGCGKDAAGSAESIEISEEAITEEKSTVESDLSKSEITDEKQANPNVIIDWDYYNNQMKEEDKEDFKEYLDVLNGEQKFYCFQWMDKELTFEEYLKSIESNEQPDIASITLVDLDNQNGKELVIHFYEGGGNYLILTRDDGKFYGTNMGTRWLENLQNDGKYIASGGAGDLYLYTMEIDSNGLRTNEFGELHGESKEDGSVEDKLEVDGRVIEDNKSWFEENYANPVVWIE